MGSTSTGPSPTEVKSGDFNGDGIPDIAAADNGSATVSVLLGKGDGTFRPRQAFSTGSGPYGLAIADFNSDGVADLSVTDQNSNTASVLLGTSLHGVSALQTFSLASRAGARDAMTYLAQVQTRIFLEVIV